MANVELSYPGRSRHYLDASPMIAALRLQPGDFEFSRGSLEHVPSRHRFHFDRRGRVSIEADCGCAMMQIRPEQTDELVATFDSWRRDYWTPLETNREFAGHFREPNAFMRMCRDIRMAFRRFRRRDVPRALPDERSSPVPVTPAE